MTPIITTPNASLTVKQGVFFDYDVIATNTFPGTKYTFTGMPNGIFITSDPLTSDQPYRLSGMSNEVGTFTINIVVSNPEDIGGESATGTLTLIVTVDKPVIYPINPSARPIQGFPFSFKINAINNPTSFTAVNLPAGLTINETTGEITGTPTTLGKFIVNLTATNSGGTSDIVKLSLEVIIPPPVITLNPSIVIGHTGVMLTNNNQAYYQILATNKPTKYTSTKLPTGLILNATTGRITGKPLNIGTTSVIITVTNTTGSTSASLVFDIKPGIPRITTISLDKATEEIFYSKQITATNLPFKWRAIGLPPGLQIDPSTGVISGTVPLFGGNPSAETAPQNYNVSIYASNNYGESLAKVLILAVGEIWPSKGILTGTSDGDKIVSTFQVGPCPMIGRGACAEFEGDVINTNTFSQEPNALSLFFPNTPVYVEAGGLCPGKLLPQLSYIKGKLLYHAYPLRLGIADAPSRKGKLIIPGKTWKQCGITEGKWMVICTFVPLKCWRDAKYAITISYPYLNGGHYYTICKGNRGDCAQIPGNACLYNCA